MLRPEAPLRKTSNFYIFKGGAFDTSIHYGVPRRQSGGRVRRGSADFNITVVAKGMENFANQLHVGGGERMIKEKAKGTQSAHRNIQGPHKKGK